MDDFCKYLGINSTYYLICCMFWILSTAERNTISEVAGSRVILQAKNDPNMMVVQLTWKLNRVTLFSFNPPRNVYISNESISLNIKMLHNQSYALVIESVQKLHTGNYTCEINTEKQLQEQHWELIVTDPKEAGNELVIAVAIAVPCTCCLIFIVTLTILLRARKRRPEDHSPNAQMEEDCIYENCLENNVNHRQGYEAPQHYKTRTVLGQSAN